METLEEVIKNKTDNYFLDSLSVNIFDFWVAHFQFNITGTNIYTYYTYYNVDHKNINEIMQKVIPHIYYLISKFKNEKENEEENEEENELRQLHVKISYHRGEPLKSEKRKFRINDEKNLLKLIKESIQYYKDKGYGMNFSNPCNIMIELIPKKYEHLIDSEKENEEEEHEEEEYEEEYEVQEEEDSEEETRVINTEQTFLSDECVICLNNPPTVLFCNCGHIAICVECNKTKSLNNCPICKTENTIKRMIEY